MADHHGIGVFPVKVAHLHAAHRRQHRLEKFAVVVSDDRRLPHAALAGTDSVVVVRISPNRRRHAPRAARPEEFALLFKLKLPVAGEIEIGVPDPESGPDGALAECADPAKLPEPNRQHVQAGFRVKLRVGPVPEIRRGTFRPLGDADAVQKDHAPLVGGIIKVMIAGPFRRKTAAENRQSAPGRIRTLHP